MFHEIKASLQQLYLEDKRPWLVGFSGGKDSTMLASLIFDARDLPGDLLNIFKDDLESRPRLT